MFLLYLTMRLCSINVLKMHLVILGLMLNLALIILVFQIAWHMISAIFLIAIGACNKVISIGLTYPTVSAHNILASVHLKNRSFTVSLSPLIELQFRQLFVMLASNLDLLCLEISLFDKKL